MSGPNIAPFGAVGGNGSSLTPNAIPNAGQAYSISAVTDYSYDNTPAARTFRGASPVPSGPNFNPSWNNQDGLVTSLNVALAGSPSGRGQFRPNSGNSRANTRVFGGSSVMSAHNNSTGSPTYDPGNNFGYGQGGCLLIVLLCIIILQELLVAPIFLKTLKQQADVCYS